VVDPSIKAKLLERLELLELEVTGHAPPRRLAEAPQAIDPKMGEIFTFGFKDGWEWQRDELERISPSRSFSVSIASSESPWLGSAIALQMPDDSRHPRSSGLNQRDRGAQETINRAWDLYENRQSISASKRRC
jgi:hypothetical protein